MMIFLAHSALRGFPPRGLREQQSLVCLERQPHAYLTVYLAYWLYRCTCRCGWRMFGLKSITSLQLGSRGGLVLCLTLMIHGVNFPMSIVRGTSPAKVCIRVVMATCNACWSSHFSSSIPTVAPRKPLLLNSLCFVADGMAQLLHLSRFPHA
jgi:hypothetical protein